ncbi:unnamed protein product, partial [Rotaria sordida]
EQRHSTIFVKKEYHEALCTISKDFYFLFANN